MIIFGVVFVLIMVGVIILIVYSAEQNAKSQNALDDYVNILNPRSGVLPETDTPDDIQNLYRKPSGNPRYILFNIPYPDNYKKVLAGSIPVAGTYYKADETATWLAQDPIGIELERDKNNPHDSNAIKVWGINYTRDGRNTQKYDIGFLPGDLAAKITEKEIEVEAVPVKLQTNEAFNELQKVYITIFEK